MLSEKGNLSQTPVIKLLLSIYEQSMTGILYLKQDDILKVLYFNEGKLVWAISNSNQDSLLNILIEANFSNELELNEFNKDSNKDTFGKILVEKGIITLEELIDATKIQLKQIIISVLRWEAGGYQFTKDLPPQKFLSLELNIIEFVSEFIFKIMDMSLLWKEIGSLQIELKQNPDGSKLKMYKLSQNQQNLLNLFDGNIKLEGILSKYSGVEREILLKTIYFFLISELLIKKGFDLDSLSIKNEDDKETEGEFTKNIEHKNVNFNKSDEDINHLTKTPKKEEENGFEYSFDKEDVAKEEFAENIELDRLTKHENSNNDNEVVFKGFDDVNSKRVINKKINFMLFAIIAIFILTGILFIVLKDNKEEINKNNIDDNSLKVNKIFKTDNKPVLKKKIINEVSETDIKKNKEKELSVEMKPVNNTVKKEIKEKVNKGKSALEYFKNGSYSVAADIWKKENKQNNYKFTILLEVACMKISIKKAYRNIKIKDKFFLISRKIGNKSCFRVCWGKFRSKSDAADALSVLPKYFFKQESPPEVIKLSF